jgi:hypothetical protein
LAFGFELDSLDYELGPELAPSRNIKSTQGRTNGLAETAVVYLQVHVQKKFKNRKRNRKDPSVARKEMEIQE